MSDSKKQLTPEQLAKIAGGAGTKHTSSQANRAPSSSHKAPVKHYVSSSTTGK